MILIKITWSCAGTHALGKIKPLTRRAKEIKRKGRSQVQTGRPVGLFSVLDFCGALFC